VQQPGVTTPPGEEAFVVKTNGVKLAYWVLENIVRRELTTQASTSGHTSYSGI